MIDFINIYDSALDRRICDRIIEMFNSSSQKKSGVTGQGLNLENKQSEDIAISLQPEWTKINQVITQITLGYLVDYMRCYAHLLTGVLSPQVKDTKTGKNVALKVEDIAHLSDKAIAKIIARLYYLGVVNAQKYDKGIGGYYHYHSEIYPDLHNNLKTNNSNSSESLHRVLLFMYYLNDVSEGGETEFYYQKRLITPQAGRLVIAPAGFTHTHKGHIPLSDDKYILTSWVLFQPAEYLYSEFDSPEHL
ncbi:2OG-Fe(II) oxygenase superfamily protein [Hyella patelloides LEGE 07179]|uniref:2OG-Fe(II) oxygenase superfamily protein n=1 Tax=Hyella patelloides LEGE 07179 TaxID=945734 RepID=A0A563VIR1_9CYAN|nr:2OG-Fe(II) oxygenase [Hyella patelloides]VEP11328.1 2OG-Fe(II) oxygenase superfamily protein [Hyella patelloides LEGE 07179]